MTVSRPTNVKRFASKRIFEMTSTDQINAALERFAAVLDESIGAGEALGPQEVARNTGVSSETIRNYRDGHTVPDMRWMLRFSAAYRKGFSELVTKVWQAFEGVIGGHYELEAERPHRDIKPLHMTFSIDERLVRVQRVLADVMCPRSAGGESITAAERAHLDPDVAAILVQAEGLRMSIEAHTLKSRVG